MLWTSVSGLQQREAWDASFIFEEKSKSTVQVVPLWGIWNQNVISDPKIEQENTKEKIDWERYLWTPSLIGTNRRNEIKIRKLLSYISDLNKKCRRETNLQAIIASISLAKETKRKRTFQAVILNICVVIGIRDSGVALRSRWGKTKWNEGKSRKKIGMRGRSTDQS